jgi:hypothetical protein
LFKNIYHESLVHTNLEIGMSKTSNKAKKRAKAVDNAKSRK